MLVCPFLSATGGCGMPDVQQLSTLPAQQPISAAQLRAVKFPVPISSGLCCRAVPSFFVVHTMIVDRPLRRAEQLTMIFQVNMRLQILGR